MSPLDELAHEEGLRFGACTPFEKELIRKDGTRVPVLVATAVLKLSPFRWITFVQDLRERDRQENVDEEVVEVTDNFEEIIGTSAAMKRVMGQVEVVAPTDATVLILGETGTGKELVARAIHRLSPRRNLPFISLNCAAIPTGLLESELFGYERGAFTGALGQKIGRFEMAHRGTLFLDEVGDIPLDLQPKLLARSAGEGVREIGRHAHDPHRRPAGGGNQSESDADDGGQTLPQRSVLPAEGFPDHHASVARSSRGHTRPRPPLHQEVRREDGSDDRQDPVGHDARPW